MDMKVPPVEYICRCFLQRNIFVKKYRMHIVFENQVQFEEDYRQHLRFQGCVTEKQYREVLNEITAEVERRKSFHELSFSNYKNNQISYGKLHPGIWTLKQSFLDKRLLSIIKDAQEVTENTLLASIEQNGGNITESGVFRFPVFTTEVCKQLVEEIKNFENFPGPKTRPNTMNNYGISFDEMGLSDGLIVPLVRDYLQPITKALFPQWGGGSIDSFKAFVVNYTYSEDGDKDLALHYDNAEVTINISLNADFEGGLLQFGGLWGEEDSHSETLIGHQVGHGILHCGRHMHKALPITAGQRYNLIIWMRSSAVRNQLCPMCGEVPMLAEVPFAGEGFTIPQSQSSSCTCS